ncbi:MAG: hypothetical protein R2838_07800 [Caldilineaceae bacterium]
MPNFAGRPISCTTANTRAPPPSAFAVPAVRWREMAQARLGDGREPGRFAMPAGITIQRSWRGTARRDSARI